MSFPKSVYIRELGPREGFQTLSKEVSVSEKLELIEALSLTGVKEIEVCSFVRSDKVAQMADAEEIVKKIKKRPEVKYTALCLNSKGFGRAEETGVLLVDPWLYVSASATFFKKNNNTSLEEFVKSVPERLSTFNASGKKVFGLMVSAAFGCNYEGKISAEAVLDVIQQSAGAVAAQGQYFKEICLADTMGWATPEMLKRLLSEVRSKFSKSAVSLHLHDTRGSGMANVYAGLEEGVACFESSVAGMGGCPFAKGAAGNVPTEDVVYLAESLGISTGINLEAYVKAAKIAERIVGYPLPGKYYRSGG